MTSLRRSLLALGLILLAASAAYRLAFHAFDLLLVAAWAALALATFPAMRGATDTLQRLWWGTLAFFPCGNL
ncbi:hypothetical protein [Deinococcus sp.]|uniref:hypothetical protein n=1 Tax=Deinococcus sp. TaxID=47478 RepID=UPI003CC5636A